MSRPCVIFGAYGQDGRLLAEQLEEAGRAVLQLGRGELAITDEQAVAEFIAQNQPAELYYLAAHHHSAQDAISSNDAQLFRLSYEVHVLGLLHMLEAIRIRSPHTRLFYAASSHIFGNTTTGMQNEETPLNPRCAYGITKSSGVQLCRYYRNTHGVFASVGILYNHESPYRRESFVSQKIVRAAHAIAAGKQDQLVLGDLGARVDWGYAPDYVNAMTRILALPNADDFVIATGETHSVQEFVKLAFGALGLDWQKHVVEKSSILQKQRRVLKGDATKLRNATGWKPSISFAEMVQILIKAHDNAR